MTLDLRVDSYGVNVRYGEGDEAVTILINLTPAQTSVLRRAYYDLSYVVANINEVRHIVDEVLVRLPKVLNKEVCSRVKFILYEKCITPYMNSLSVTSYADKEEVKPSPKDKYTDAWPKTTELDPNDMINQLCSVLPALNSSEYYSCPVCKSTYTIRDMIIHLNDEHLSTRDYIADWLETLDVNLEFKPKTKSEIQTKEHTFDVTSTLKQYLDAYSGISKEEFFKKLYSS